jgi:hypothetical protein
MPSASFDWAALLADHAAVSQQRERFPAKWWPHFELGEASFSEKAPDNSRDLP